MPQLNIGLPQYKWFRRLACRFPTECPFTKLGLPPMCKLNPLYEEIVRAQWLEFDSLEADTP